ncbi:hypothetical protein Tco_1288070 [Tanacetum coccineum]
MKEVLDIKYKELEESKSILEMLENYVMYKKKLDEILIGKERLNKKEFSEQDKVGIIEDGLPKKMCDPGNYVLRVKINGVVEMSALVDIGASVSVLPYSLYKDLGHGDPRPYQTNLTMADNTQAKAMGVVKNVRFVLMMGYPSYLFSQARSRSYVEAFEMKGDDDKQFDHKDYWTRVDELDVENTCLKKETEMPTQAEEGSSEPRQEHRGLNASLSEIEQRNVWRDSMLIQNNYMLEHSMPILHYLANQGGSYGLGGDDYFTSVMPDFGGSSLGYAVGGSSRGDGFNDDDMDE